MKASDRLYRLRKIILISYISIVNGKVIDTKKMIKTN